VDGLVRANEATDKALLDGLTAPQSDAGLMATSTRGQTGAETLSTMDDKVTLDELVKRYKSKRDPEEPPLVGAASVLASVGDRLHPDTKDTLVKEGGFIFRKEGIPPGLRLSPRLVARIQDRSKAGSLITQSDYMAYLARQPGAHDLLTGKTLTDEQVNESEAVIYFDPYRDDPERMVVPASDLTALMSAALVAHSEVELEVEPARTRREDDIAAGKISDRALTELEYSRRYDVGGEVLPLLVIGWLPGAFAGIIAGIIVALITSDWGLFLPIALGAAFLGYLLTLGLDVLFGVADMRWFRSGSGGAAAGIIFLVTGPAVALLLAFLILSLA
jgi:hypothetical protein